MNAETRTIQQQLCEPFSASEIKQREGRGGKRFDYIDARSAHQRLDDVLGPGGWQTTYKVLDFDSKAVECSLSVYLDDRWITKTDVGYPNSALDAEKDETEPFKAAYSDALKRAAVQLGVGRHLYNDKPAQRPPNRPPEKDAPPTQQADFSAQLLALMAETGVNSADLVRITGGSSSGRPLVSAWLKEHPDKTVQDLVKEAEAQHVNA